MVIVEATEATDEIVEALRRLIPQLLPASEPITRAELAEIIEAPGTWLLLARVPDAAGPIVGTLTLAAYRTPGGVRVWIEDVVVEVASRGQGIGEALVREALARAERLGPRHADLTTAPSREAANRLYRRMGFEQHTTNVYRFYFPP